MIANENPIGNTSQLVKSDGVVILQPVIYTTPKIKHASVLFNYCQIIHALFPARLSTSWLCIGQGGTF